MLHSFSSPQRPFARRFRSCSARPAFSFYHIFHRRAIGPLRRAPQKAASRQHILSMSRRAQLSDIQHVFPNALKTERRQDAPRRRYRSCPSRPRLCIHRAGRSAPREAPKRLLAEHAVGKLHADNLNVSVANAAATGASPQTKSSISPAPRKCGRLFYKRRAAHGKTRGTFAYPHSHLPLIPFSQ